MKTIKVSRERAIIIASNHNNIPLEKAKSYTDSELREVLRHLNLKPGFQISIVIHHPQNKYNHKKASNRIKDPNHLKAITNTHQPQTKKNTKTNKLNHNLNP